MFKKLSIGIIIVGIWVTSCVVPSYFMYVRGLLITSFDTARITDRVPDIKENQDYLAFLYHKVEASHCFLSSEQNTMLAKLLFSGEIERELERIELLYQGKLVGPHNSVKDKLKCNLRKT